MIANALKTLAKTLIKITKNTLGWIGLLIFISIVCYARAQIQMAQAAAQIPTEPLRIAVAANFVTTAQQLAQEFTEQTKIKVEIIAGSSGKLTEQIQHDAPFDVFLSANRHFPQKLVDSGKVLHKKIFDYAVGRLVFVGKQPITSCIKIGIADPKSAPYGTAAVHTLQKMGLLTQVHNRFVIAHSVGQVANWLAQHAVDCAWIALSQMQMLKKQRNHLPPYQLIEVERTLLTQSAVIVQHTHHIAAAQKWIKFLLSASSQKKIQRAGYYVKDPV